MIKGRYVAQIEVDFEYAGANASYEEIHERLHGDWIAVATERAIFNIFSTGKPKITVTKQYANVVEDEE